MNTKVGAGAGLALAVLAVVAIVPVLALAGYAFSMRWDRSLLPEDLTLHWLEQVVVDTRISASVIKTIAMALIVAFFTTAAGAAASISAKLFSPFLLRILDIVSLLPFAIPPVVVAVATLEIFVGQFGATFNIMAVYVMVSIPLLFPLVHNCVAVAVDHVDAATFLEAAGTLGASVAYTVVRVIVPVLWPAILAAFTLVFVATMSEFVIANLLLAGTLELLQPLMNSYRGVNGHVSAALVMVWMIAVASLVAATTYALRK